METTRPFDVVVVGGGVAGTAAALALRRGTHPSALAPAEVQAAMRERGVPLHMQGD